MKPLSFTHVPAEGYSGFSTELSTGTWAVVDTSSYEGPNQSASKSLSDASVFVALKLRMKWGIAALVQATEGSGTAKSYDRTWDTLQKQLNALLMASAASMEPAKHEAAKRLQQSLLLGGGEGQTKLRYQQEVDFGRKQVLMTSQGQGAADMTLLGLGVLLASIDAATDSLAEAIGHGDYGHAPHRRRIAATSACGAAFASAAQLLAWIAAHGTAEDRELAMDLRGPLVELVARYPAKTVTASETVEAGG